jgi:hypothetical protein
VLASQVETPVLLEVAVADDRGRFAIRFQWIRIDPMKTIALAEGDVGWVFPHFGNSPGVLEALSVADARMRQLADHLGVTPGWTRSGLEFHRLASVTDLFGCAEIRDVSFVAELESGVLGPELRREGGPPWEVSANIAVRCDAHGDCGMHIIEEWPASRYDSPLEAATALADVAQWLRDRGTAEPPASWRDRDPRSGHR